MNENTIEIRSYWKGKNERKGQQMTRGRQEEEEEKIEKEEEERGEGEN